MSTGRIPPISQANNLTVMLYICQAQNLNLNLWTFGLAHLGVVLEGPQELGALLLLLPALGARGLLWNLL